MITKVVLDKVSIALSEWMTMSLALGGVYGKF